MRRLAAISYLLLCLASFNGHASDDQQLSAEELFDSDFEEQAITVSEGELRFIAAQPEASILHSVNTLKITPGSLATGWVELAQCYENLDAVPEVIIGYRYKQMRNLQLISHNNIRSARVQDNSVHLINVEQQASICVKAEVLILKQVGDDYYLHNGPYHRKFLDGYYPFHLSLTVHYPQQLMKLMKISPEPQPGFVISAQQGSVTIDSWFEGKLNVDIRFSRLSR